MNISVGYYLHVFHFFILFYKNLVYFENTKVNTKIASGLLTKAIFLFFIISAMVPSTGFALDANWIGTTDSQWQENDNWSAAYPVSGNTATFDSAGNGNTTIDLTGGVTVASITFDTINAAAYIIGTGGAGSQSITLDNTGIISATATVENSQTFDADIVLAGSYTFTNNATDISALLSFNGGITTSSAGSEILSLSGSNTGDNIISGIIGDGAGTMSVAKDGSGTWILSGANTYSGGTTISAGVVSATTSAEALGTGAVTVASGAALQVTGALDFDEALTLSGTGIGDAGALRNISGDTNWSGDITLAAASRINSDLDTLTLSGATIDDAFGLTIGGAGDTTISSIIATGANTLTKDGSGTLTLSGANTYSGGTTITAGTLNINNAAALGGAAGVFTIAGGAIDNTSGGAITLSNNNAQAWDADFTFTGANALNLGTGAVTLGGNREVTVNANTLTVGGAIGGAHSLTKAGAGTLTLDSVNTYTGSTIVNSGTLNLNEGLTISSLVFSGDGTVNLAADKNIANAITNTSGATTGTLNYLGNSTTGGNIGTSNANEDLTAVNINAGTLTMNHNIYAAMTTVIDSAAVNVGSNNLTIGGALDMLGSSKLMLDILDSTTSGSITTTGAAGIPATVLLDLNIASGQYIPHGTTFTAIDGTGGVVAGGNTVTGNNPYLSFTTTGGTDLVIVASRTSTGFNSWATTGNSKAAGRSLEDAGSHSPSGDMLTVLNAMETLQTSEIEGALTQMTPQVDRGIIDVSNTALGQNVQAISNHLKYKRTGGASGVSTGDEYGAVNDVWIKAFGTYAIQKDRQEVKGYRAYVAGAAIGADVLSKGNKTAGLGLGYSHNNIDSRRTGKANTTADSLQLSLYYGYDTELNYVPRDLIYFDLLGAFAWNTYDASRTVSFNSINRTAKANYDGQQYTMYAEAGYHAPINNTTDWIPFMSLQYARLNVDGYTEKGADALSLEVNAQTYNALELGLGMKLVSKIRSENFDLVRELRFRWLYDLISDDMEVTSRFTGGGAAFTAKGARSSRHTFDLGGSLGFITNKNFTVDFDYDYSMKEDYRSHDGSAVLKFGVLLP